MLWNQATMLRFRYARQCNLSEVRNYWRNDADGTHNRLENFRGAIA
jgi:hypothetical protein